MDIKDVKLGMLVQLTSPYVQGVGTVELISDSGLVQVRLDGVVTDSIHNVGSIHNRWRTCASNFEPYLDPEADMVVWDALEVGEHYNDDGECVKLNKHLACNLSKNALIHRVSRLGKYHKVKPL